MISGNRSLLIFQAQVCGDPVESTFKACPECQSRLDTADLVCPMCGHEFSPRYPSCKPGKIPFADHSRRPVLTRPKLRRSSRSYDPPRVRKGPAVDAAGPPSSLRPPDAAAAAAAAAARGPRRHVSRLDSPAPAAHPRAAPPRPSAPRPPLAVPLGLHQGLIRAGRCRPWVGARRVGGWLA